MNKATGPLPLFPLRMVLFPGAMLHLKVFEARYLDLVGRCLRSREPFGVVCIAEGQEVGSAGAARLEPVGVLAHIQEVDAEQAGILQVRCTGGVRFRMQGPPTQAADGLWSAPVEHLPEDEVSTPPEALHGTVQALSNAVAALRERGTMPFAEPMRLDDAGWVANRWCELLPVSLAARQKLMELDDPVVRLQLVDDFLRGRKVVTG
jgi:hypothetical protein